MSKGIISEILALIWRLISCSNSLDFLINLGSDGFESGKWTSLISCAICDNGVFDIVELATIKNWYESSFIRQSRGVIKLLEKKVARVQYLKLSTTPLNSASKPFEFWSTSFLKTALDAKS